MTWEHKNHLRLLEALALLRDREGLEVSFVCTGFKTDFWPHVERRLKELGLEGQVRFPGLVSQEELRALYCAAQFVFVPTLFEAASAPVFEAWQMCAPVACSSVTSLPEQTAGAALLFEPFSVEEIARALARMATDGGLRDDLRRLGRRRLGDFSIERTARAYRAVYRRAAGRPLNSEDRHLLGWDWMRQSIGGNHTNDWKDHE
jgi:glycosyltransferase involved in cell wall biosynthesis